MEVHRALKREFEVELERSWSGDGVEMEGSDSAMIEWSEALREGTRQRVSEYISDTPLSEVCGSQITHVIHLGPWGIGSHWESLTGDGRRHKQTTEGSGDGGKRERFHVILGGLGHNRHMATRRRRWTRNDCGWCPQHGPRTIEFARRGKTRAAPRLTCNSSHLVHCTGAWPRFFTFMPSLMPIDPELSTTQYRSGNVSFVFSTCSARPRGNPSLARNCRVASAWSPPPPTGAATAIGTACATACPPATAIGTATGVAALTFCSNCIWYANLEGNEGGELSTNHCRSDTISEMKTNW